MYSTQQHGAAELQRWGLVRVSEDFRVIALGLPVPRYRGAPLDPPLRSRFQSRDVSDLSYLVSSTTIVQGGQGRGGGERCSVGYCC